MSERSSFVTDYIDCPRCLKLAKQALALDEKHLRGIQIESWVIDLGSGRREMLPIIAGKVGGMGKGDSALIVEEELEDVVRGLDPFCHDVRVAVVGDHVNVCIVVAGPKGVTATYAEL